MVFLYGIIWENGAINPRVTGLQDNPLEFIDYLSISAVVSECTPSELPLKHSYVLQYNTIIEKLFNNSCILPFRFGTIMESQSQVNDLIHKHYKYLKHQLTYMEGKTEYGLKIWGPHSTPQSNKREAGSGTRYIMGKYEHYTLLEETTKFVQRKIKSCVSEVKHELRDSGKLLMDLYFLVPHNKKKAFKSVINKLNLNMEFVLTGPWPPYNFVNISLNELNKDRQTAHELD